MKLLARFRRWLHLLGHVFVLPIAWLISGENGPHIHRAVNNYKHTMTPNRFGLKTTSEHVYMGCTCGRGFWAKDLARMGGSGG
jgi:hypothetical protein